MSKPKTTPGTTTGVWSGSGGYVEFEPARAPPVLLSKLRLNQGTGERAVEFVWDSLARMMRENGGTITGSYLDKLLEDVDRYYYPMPMPRIGTPFSRPIADDAVSIIEIGRSSIASKNFGNARLFRLDSLSEEAAGFIFVNKDRLKDVKLKAAKEKNLAATAVLAQLEEYLGILFGSGGVKYKTNTIMPLTLRISRAIKDDTLTPDQEQEQQLQAAPFREKYQGVVAFYKSGKKCDRVLVVLARNSTESRVNLEVAVRNHKITELKSRLKEFEERLVEMDN
jgi:hypothetical protein